MTNADRRLNRLDRLREIVNGGGRQLASRREQGTRTTTERVRAEAAHVLGGAIEMGPAGPCTVIRRTYEEGHRYGRQDLGASPALTTGALAFLAGERPSRKVLEVTDETAVGCPPGSVVCFDLETTGLSGGAGTVAFLVGLGWFESGTFHTCQYFLSHLGDEAPMLRAVAQVLAKAHTVVTFNGRSFDGPVTDTRFAFHRQPSPLGTLRHVDLLHASRRLWKRDECRLVRLERDVLGLHRVGDVPGAEIPARYVGFLRGGDIRSLGPVCEHNRLDLVSLGVLTGLACRLVREGVTATGGGAQALGLGRLYENAGWTDRAVECYRAAAGADAITATERSSRPSVTAGANEARAEAIGRLAAVYRRRRHHTDAAALWTQLLSVSGVSDRLRREATVALAVHHEHRVRDLAAAERFARAALREEAHPGRRRAVQHRLTRLERKRDQSGLML